MEEGHGVGSLPGALSLCSSGPRSREEGAEEDMVLGLLLVQSLRFSGPGVSVAEIAVGRRFHSGAEFRAV